MSRSRILCTRVNESELSYAVVKRCRAFRPDRAHQSSNSTTHNNSSHHSTRKRERLRIVGKSGRNRVCASDKVRYNSTCTPALRHWARSSIIQPTQHQLDTVHTNTKPLKDPLSSLTIYSSCVGSVVFIITDLRSGNAAAVSCILTLDYQCQVITKFSHTNTHIHTNRRQVENI